MTCREKYAQEHPDDNEIWDGMCPSDYGYLPVPDYCYADGRAHCEECWDREIPGNVNWTCEFITVDGSKFTKKGHVDVKNPDKINLEEAATEVFTGIKKVDFTSIVNDDGSVTILSSKHIVSMNLKIDKEGK